MNNVIIKDLDRPSWFMRVDSITEAKEYIDSIGGFEALAEWGLI